jgi:hypothetical protein
MNQFYLAIEKQTPANSSASFDFDRAQSYGNKDD